MVINHAFIKYTQVTINDFYVITGVQNIKKSEGKDASSGLVHQLNHKENNIPNHHLYKRQISPQLQSFDSQVTK